MQRKINVLVVEPGKAPRPATVTATLENYAEIVGGPIEVGCCLPQRVMLICNGEGKNKGLPPNRLNPCGKHYIDYIAGTFFLCGFEGEHFTSLSPSQQATFQSYFAKPGEFMIVGTGTVCTTPNDLAETARKLWARMKSGETVVLTKWGGQEEGAAT